MILKPIISLQPSCRRNGDGALVNTDASVLADLTAPLGPMRYLPSSAVAHPEGPAEHAPQTSDEIFCSAKTHYRTNWPTPQSSGCANAKKRYEPSVDACCRFVLHADQVTPTLRPWNDPPLLARHSGMVQAVKRFARLQYNIK